MFDQEGGSDKKGVSPHLLLLRGRREENRDFAPKRFFERKEGGMFVGAKYRRRRRTVST